jgi:hypothetical protein
MFSIDGVPLDNPTMGWSLRSETESKSGRSFDRPSISGAGLDGVATGLRATVGPPIFPLVVESPEANVGALQTLLVTGSELKKSTLPGKYAVYEVMSLSPAAFVPDESLWVVTAMVRLPDIYYRDTALTTWAQQLPSNTNPSSTVVNVFDGITAPVRDAVFRIRGAANGQMKVSEPSGSFFAWPGNLSAGQYLRFHSDTGRAFVTNSDTWSGGTEVTGDIANGPGPYPFEITPIIVNSDPRVRSGQVTLIVNGSSSLGTFEVRGRRAYAE